MRLAVFLSFILLPFFSQAIECVGYSEYVDENQKLVSDSTKLNLVFDSAETEQLTADIGDVHFMVQGTKSNDSYLMMVTLGPEYTSGVTAGLTWDKNNNMRISRVDQHKVYRLICNK